MDKDKNIHQETVTLDGDGGGGEVPPSLLLKVIWLLTAPFFTEEKNKKSRSLEKATLGVVLLCVLHYFKLLIKTIY